MRGAVVFDSEAFSALSGRKSARQNEVRAAMRAAARLGREVIVPTVILADLYRGPQRNQLVDSCLSRETGITTRDTDKHFARIVGGLLAGSSLGSEHLADAHVVGAGLEAGRSVILTGDPQDIGALAAPYPNIVVKALP